jgi:hypothetical protein
MINLTYNQVDLGSMYGFTTRKRIGDRSRTHRYRSEIYSIVIVLPYRLRKSITLRPSNDFRYTTLVYGIASVSINPSQLVKFSNIRSSYYYLICLRPRNLTRNPSIIYTKNKEDRKVEVQRI